MTLSTPDKLFPVYVFEAPVRIWHWVMALCMVVLAVTGYLIGSPLQSVSGEASDHFLFGYIRFAHFAAAYIFAVMFVMRVLWSFMGNRFSREMFLVPVSMFQREFWRGFFSQAKHYLFMKSHAEPWQGHNPIAAAAMFFMYTLGTVFMICTGFALYGEGLGMNSWAFSMFTSWVMPLLGYSQRVHTLHHLGMWWLLIFTMVHIYMVFREDTMTNETIIGAMFNGWRTVKK